MHRSSGMLILLTFAVHGIYLLQDILTARCAGTTQNSRQGPMPDFVHLHCHTEYSLLDGAIRIKDLCAKTREFGLPAAAITDHGNLFGALHFYLEAKKQGIKPLIGCEVYVAGCEHTDRSPDQAKNRFHLVLLAMNQTGYLNLVKLVSTAHLHGFFYKPRVDKKLLQQHNEGLIALSACLAGEVPRRLLKTGMAAALETAREYAAIFPDRYYIELQSNGLEEQVIANKGLVELAETLGLPLVATNDCHYLTKEDVEAHDVLLCIQTASCVSDEKRMRFETKELFYKSPQEMALDFSHLPQALENTLAVAERCNLDFDLKSHHFPIYDLPPGKTLHEEFVELSRKGLRERLDILPYRAELDEQAYWQRLEVELDVIAQMGFEGYFLIVQDFINWAKDRRIPVGPGRGSAAGSVVAWALRITNLDPIRYNLLFERFLNIERVSMPDIDVDFCERRRGEVIEYVTHKYGEDSVAQITTFGTMKSKAVIRDVGRALGLNFGETDRIAKLVPEDLKMTIDKALEAEPELRNMAASDPVVGQLVEVSRRLEGLCRHASTHAAGVVIGDKPLERYLPLYRGKNNEIVTQFDMKMVEKVGLIKFDFLGLRTMTLIQDTLDVIDSQEGKKAPDLDTLPLDGPGTEETYALYARGDTDGVFQVESAGMRRYLRQLKPTCFDDIIAMLALYRPGPLGSGMVEQFIRRKHGLEPVLYPLPQLEETLKETYGVIVYQEQVMRIAQLVANYTLGGADLLRRAMGKKIAEAMAEQRVRFVEGAKENSIPESKANEIFDLMEKFAEYGFNKSHSAAYALISYYTAYLKTQYPTEFMAALLSSEVNNQDKVLKYIFSCKDMGIEVLPPDVNKSRWAFSVSEGRIVFGLGGVKNVGNEAIKEIVARRGQGGEYKSLLDFCQRVTLRKVTKRVIENLIKSGAMDCFGCSRAGLLAALDIVVTKAQRQAKEKESGMGSLFSLMQAEPKTLPGVGMDCPEQLIEEFPAEVKSRFEKDALGFFLTSNPLLPFRAKCRRLQLLSLEDIADMPDHAVVKLALLVTDKTERYNKKGDKWAVCQVEDLTGRTELLVFAQVFQQMRPLLEQEAPLLVEASIMVDERDSDEDNRQIKLRAESAMLLESVAEEQGRPVRLPLPASVLEGGGVEEFKALLAAHKGKSPVHVEMVVNGAWGVLELSPEFCVTPGPEFDRAMERWTLARRKNA